MRWIDAGGAAELDVDEVAKFDADVGPLAIYHTDGGYFATQDTCTHAVASLSDGFVEDGMIECPLHAAKFCIRTGKAKSLPATEPLETYPVQVVDGRILVGLPLELGAEA
ncbi:bifunctional 3-phenylpropionate/cinnamic acid dioxygenase ferredoxin subunit [Sphingomonas sp. IC081]|uniref:Initial dioxygenase ferredoxin subunit n=1 Tax=Sphingomonas sp. CB3 TaxID=76582 RepID=O85285_9SPHN|nr:bifunctional 3-phenylpropionate/cinnamic acid dioxygenase ferredoxin subunit [Sphingomonas sp. IC081]AAC38618.1 initial dioxygenase ferredoxin subunit [Sphingomonas sp. CB3]QDK35718.1 bifunctional 3-phenylpropionate/cinnamic acid dioxygenase ferredoxin subunit [Sphingomonas sp. IC081]